MILYSPSSNRVIFKYKHVTYEVVIDPATLNEKERLRITSASINDVHHAAINDEITDWIECKNTDEMLAVIAKEEV